LGIKPKSFVKCVGSIILKSSARKDLTFQQDTGVHGVLGVASSNLVIPTLKISHLRHEVVSGFFMRSNIGRTFFIRVIEFCWF
jgi:hypothetical protein